jgi:glycosyltransferase involved in cell wall biosynthesis
MKKLFFDIYLTGHHSEYIGHLVNFISENKDSSTFFFIVNPEFSIKFPAIVAKAKQQPNITWVEILPTEYENALRGGIIKRSFAEYKLMDRFATYYKVDCVCLLYFNTFQFACSLFRPSYKISGILFSQFSRMEKKSWDQRLKYLRKYLTTKLYTFNTKIERIFILNDEKTADYLNIEFNSNIFKMLPDPVPELFPLENFDIYSHYKIQRNRKIFLHLGSLGDRKGTFEIIDAAKLIKSEVQFEILILLVGKAENAATTQFLLNKINECSKNTNVNFIWDDQFVTNEMMKSLFDQSFAILMPYKNTEASSGILGHAAAANKKVIATGGGLIKEMIEKNNLGFLIEKVTPNALALKMEAILLLKLDTKISDKFLKEHNPFIFSEKIILN